MLLMQVSGLTHVVGLARHRLWQRRRHRVVESFAIINPLPAQPVQSLSSCPPRLAGFVYSCSLIGPTLPLRCKLFDASASRVSATHRAATYFGICHVLCILLATPRVGPDMRCYMHNVQDPGLLSLIWYP